MEEGKLMLMNKGRGREGAGKEMESWSRSAGVETLEPLQGLPPVDRQNTHIRGGEQ